MSGNFDFYFDFTSPYGYFGAMRINQLAARYGRSVDWHPVLLGVVFKTTGGMPLTMIPLKGDYSLHDFERTARFHGIPYNRPAVFPLATQACARAMLWLQATYGAERAVVFAQAAFQSYFVEGLNIGDSTQVAAIATKLGFDADALSAAISGVEIKDRLKAEVETAVTRGVFGSPFVILDGESFWGFDRFDQIEAYLKNGSI